VNPFRQAEDYHPIATNLLETTVFIWQPNHCSNNYKNSWTVQQNMDNPVFYEPQKKQETHSSVNHKYNDYLVIT